MFGSGQWMYSSGGGFYGTQIDGSLRFNDDDSPKLTRTPATTSNRKTWTWSGWVKRGNLSTNKILFSTDSGYNGGGIAILFDSSDRFSLYNAAKNFANVRTSAVYRDVSAWYHLVVAVDSTQATSTDRVKLYVNGEVITSFSATGGYPSLNQNTYVNDSAYAHGIGGNATSTVSSFDGYMAEINFVDGQSLDASSFGETKSGVWIPKAYSGSYGTNGFHLEFAGNANDSSGNGNNWTANNISSHDYVPDSPTNNFCTFNSVDNQGQNLSQGNLVPAGTNSWDTVRGTYAMSSGKWYWEERIGANNADHRSGISDNKFTPSLSGSGVLSVEFYNFGYARVFYEGATEQTSSGGYAGSGDVVGYALDMDNKTFKYYKNGTLYYTKNLGSNFTVVHPMTQKYYTSASIFNFGQDSTFLGNTSAGGNSDDNGYGDFKYAPPSGYLALCTANLPVAEGVDPALDNSPQDYFSTVLYSGNGVDGRSVTGVGFQPDFTWVKVRNAAGRHVLGDVVRGDDAALFTDVTDAEATTGSRIITRIPDGFTVSDGGNVNQSGETYVAWNWKANGSGVSNTDGSITSTVSANTDAGFSIVTYTGTRSSDAGETGTPTTIGHGLGKTPAMVITKARESTANARWNVWHQGYQPDQTYLNYQLWLNESSTPNNAGWQRTDTGFSTTTFCPARYSWDDVSGIDYVAYVFAEIEGFSKCGIYTGNGSTDGAFVYTGFRPAFVLIKGISSAEHWDIPIFPNDYNGTVYTLSPNLSNAERGMDQNPAIDYLSNGFKFKTSDGNYNTNGYSYIYIAFAETPFKYANAR
jgi:hypothetical protein